MKTIVITGASSGIGYATAEWFLKANYQVVAIVRNPDSLKKLKEAYTKLNVIQCDMYDLNQIEAIVTQLSKINISQIDILVNNAGQAVAGPFAEQNFKEIEQTVQLNVISLMKMTQVLLPYLIRAKGRIINISSVSGQNGTPFLAAYCASKHAVEGFSESIRRELNIYGVKVIIIGPGSIKTPIWSKGFSDIKTRYQKSDYAESFDKFIQFADNEARNALPPSDVVENIVHAAESKSPKLRYAPVPSKWKNYYLAKLPLGLMDKIVIKALGLKTK